MHARSGTCGIAGLNRRLSLAAVPALVLICGCQDRGRIMAADNPDLEAFVRLMMPVEIEIQHNLTKPFDFEGSGEADGLEVILATRDSFGDSVKCLGTFHIELYTMRMASGDKFGKRIAFWPVSIDSDKALLQYWDHLTHFYCFPLKLSTGTLPPGRYILGARLITPAGEKLFDSYEFTHGEP